MELARLARAPLLVAVITARFIAERFGIRVTLKWPNDLLFAGRKLGGILCETSAQGGGAEALVVGIGINVAGSPDLHDENRAISLGDILHRAPSDDAEELAVQLAHHFASSWHLADMDETIAAHYDNFALENGQLWCDPGAARRFMALAAFHADGHLQLQNPADPADREELFSIQHGYQWIYQGPLAERHPLLVADLGNSRFKAALFAQAQKSDTMTLCLRGAYTSTDLAQLAAWRDWLDLHGIHERWPVHVASVNREMEELCASHFHQYGLMPVTVPKRPVRLIPSGYAIAQMGIDRLALMEGALAGPYGCQGTPLITISAGTATTIDVMDEARHHLGGVILPGLPMRFTALGEGGSLLPQLTLKEVCEAWPQPSAEPTGSLDAQLGHDTKGAIARGALLELAGAVARIRANLGPSAEAAVVLLSGGAGELLAPHLDGAIYLPDLALKGIAVMVRGG